MKKKTIWIIAVIMGLSFVILLGLQLTYIQEMANMKKEQFDESVARSLYQAAYLPDYRIILNRGYFAVYCDLMAARYYIGRFFVAKFF